MLLIRHNRLLPPYDNYEGLSIPELDRLATHQVSPDIQPPSQQEISEIIQKLDRDRFLVICSDAPRTQQTFAAVNNLLTHPDIFSVDADFNEIYFSPKLLLNADEQHPLVQIRNNLYKWISSGAAGVEPYDKLKKRVETLFEKYADKQVACFTHGFLIRLLKSYQLHQHDFDQALEKIEIIPPVNYLEITLL